MIFAQLIQYLDRRIWKGDLAVTISLADPAKTRRETVGADADLAAGLEALAKAVTERQIECLRWVRQGKSATDIGVILGISARTVEGHIARTCELLGVRTRLQAVLMADGLGLFKAARIPAVAAGLTARRDRQG